ncbi:hypothetical protein PRNP1_009882 [Phytophthora ramorum]
MTTTTRYALLKPEALETMVYTYGKATLDARKGTYQLERVPSCRWKKLSACTTQREVTEVELGALSEEETLNGIGTYVGSALCIARVASGKPKVWDYGVVVGYSWKSLNNTGTLQVTFADETIELAFSDADLQDLALETYALRPCYLRGAADIMPAEMRALHNAAYDHFNGVDQAARGSSATVLRKLTMNMVDESQVVPVSMSTEPV